MNKNVVINKFMLRCIMPKFPCMFITFTLSGVCSYLVSFASSICSSTSPSPFSTSRHVTCACVLFASSVCLCVLDFMSVVCSVIIYCEVFTQPKFSAFSLFVFQMFNNIWDGGNLKVEV